MRKLFGTILAAVAAGATLTAAHGADIEIDFGTETGPVKPVDDDHTDEELEIPYDIPSECTLSPHSVMLVTFE